MLPAAPIATRRVPKVLGLVIMLGLSLPGCASAGDRQERNLQKDAYTCSRFGAPYGSSAYSDCMLTQQRRRDLKQLESLERTQMTTQIAKDAQIMADRARKQRCDRNPDRRECRRAR